MNILLADNQDITRAGILYLCDTMPEVGLIRTIANCRELIQALSVEPEVVVVLDYTLFDMVSADELIILQERFKRTEWLLFSEELSEDFMRRVLFSNEAFSIVLKDASLDEIRTALQSVLHSEQFICSRISGLLLNRRLLGRTKELPVLTVTEKDILKSIALGRTTKEIASDRFSSIHTITTHRKNIFRKLEVNNVHEATKYALRAGIIDASEYYI